MSASTLAENERTYGCGGIDFGHVGKLEKNSSYFKKVTTKRWLVGARATEIVRREMDLIRSTMDDDGVG
jgi:hypothetical protein